MTCQEGVPPLQPQKGGLLEQRQKGCFPERWERPVRAEAERPLCSTGWFGLGSPERNTTLPPEPAGAI